MRRLAPILALATAFMITPFTTQAQPAGKMYRIGCLSVGVPTNVTAGARLPERVLKSPLGPVVDGLKDLGWIEGHNITFELRSGSPESLADLAVNLVGLPADIIVVPNAGLQLSGQASRLVRR